MKHLTFCFYLLITPIVAVCTAFFMVGLFAEEWFDLGRKILNS